MSALQPTGKVAFLACANGVHIRHIAPFCRTDAGRSTSRRPRQANDCTVRALALVCGSSYDEAYDCLKAAGRKSHDGFHFRDWAKTASFNGYEFVWQAFPAVKGQWRMNPATFAVAHTEGRYILRTAKHVFACLDGVLCDTAEPDPFRCVYGAWRALAEKDRQL